MNILLSVFLLICAAANIVLAFRLNKLYVELEKYSIPKESEKKQPTKEKTSVDDKATVAEQRYIDGIQNVLSYDVNIAKEYLRGAEKD